MDGHQFRGARIHRDMMLVSSVCRRALGCEWGGKNELAYDRPVIAQGCSTSSDVRLLLPRRTRQGEESGERRAAMAPAPELTAWLNAGSEATVRRAREFVCQSQEFRDAVDEAFDAVASQEGGFLGGLLISEERRIGVGRSAAGHVATRALASCAVPLHRAGLPVPTPSARDIDQVFDAHASGQMLGRDEFREFCAELLVRAVGRTLDGVARAFGPPVLAGIGAVWMLRLGARATVPPLHRLLPPLLLGPALGLYIACAQAHPPPPRRDPRDVRDARELVGQLRQSAEAYAVAAREVVRRQTREWLRYLR